MYLKPPNCKPVVHNVGLKLRVGFGYTNIRCLKLVRSDFHVAICRNQSWFGIRVNKLYQESTSVIRKIFGHNKLRS